jgi:hypothetical protein
MFVDEFLMSETRQILKLADAYAVFIGLLKQRDLTDLKRSDFKAIVGPLIREQFNIAVRIVVVFVVGKALNCSSLGRADIGAASSNETSLEYA